MPNEFVIDITDMQPGDGDPPVATSRCRTVSPRSAIPTWPVVTVLTTAAELEEPTAAAEGERAKRRGAKRDRRAADGDAIAE